VHTGSVPYCISKGIHMKDHSTVVPSDPDVLGGTPVFIGTRVPVKALQDYFVRGHALDDFLDDFPTVKRAQAVAVLEQEGQRTTACQ